MPIADDWTINYTAKTITHTSGTTVYTVNAFYSWLMDLFDDANQMDDPVPMSASTPSEYSFINGWTFGAEATDTQYLKSGAITDTADDTVWSNIYTIGSDAVISNITLYVEQNGSVVSGWWAAGHIDILIKTKNAGTLIDSGLVTVFAREWTYTYDHYQMDLSAGGRQPAPIAVQSDLNNQTASGTVAAYNIGVTFGSYTVDVDGNSVDENYEVEINLNSTHTVAEAYEYLKYITRRGETATLDTPAVQGQIYLSANPGTYAEVKAAPFGTFAGGNFFGARGVHFKLTGRPASEANLYELIDSDNNASISEPVSVSVAVTSVVAGDQVFVALDDGTGAVDTDQFTLSSTAGDNDINDTTIVITTTIPPETPSAGYIRVGTDKTRYQYDSWTGSTFTLNSTAHPTGLAQDEKGSAAFVPWIDETAGGTSVSKSITAPSTAKDVIIRVRKYGGAGSSIVPFESSGTISTTAGMSVAAIRTTDTVVT